MRRHDAEGAFVGDGLMQLNACIVLSHEIPVDVGQIRAEGLSCNLQTDTGHTIDDFGTFKRVGALSFTIRGF